MEKQTINLQFELKTGISKKNGKEWFALFHQPTEIFVFIRKESDYQYFINEIVKQNKPKGESEEEEKKKVVINNYYYKNKK